MKKLIKALSILIFLGLLVGGYFLGQHIFSVLNHSEGLFVFIVSIGVIFTAFMIDVFDIVWMRMVFDGDVYNNLIKFN